MIRGLLSGAAILALVACGAQPSSEPATEGGAISDSRGPSAEFRPWQGKDSFVMIIPEGMTAGALNAAAKNQCGARDFCQIAGWRSAEQAATGFPMTDAEADSMVYQYQINRQTGLEQATFDCSVWPGQERCL